MIGIGMVCVGGEEGFGGCGVGYLIPDGEILGLDGYLLECVLVD